ncbi:MAG: lactate dehydrogenase [Flavobacteriaceae bacterium]|nr:lactate dehydrogenase [Flavobacteriaceae bacterium]
MDYLELIGWIGNVFVVISFLNNDTLKLRSYNLVGASLWLVYGIVAGSFSIIFLNVVVISIQIVKITQILKERKKS